MINFGYKWNIDDESNFDIESNLIYILNGETDIYKKNEYDESKKRKFLKNWRYEKTIENQKIFKIKFQVIKLLHLFFKQYIYLSLEQFFFDFAKRTDNTIKSSPEEIIISMDSPGTLSANDITQDVDDQLYLYLILLPDDNKMKIFFSIERYQCFNFDKNSLDSSKGSKLVNILQDLMLYEDDDLKAASASLLYDIYNREHIMFNEARSSYIVLQRHLYDEMISYGTFKNSELKDLIHGVAKNEDVCEVLIDLKTSMIVDNDETEMNCRSQNIAFTTGVLILMRVQLLQFLGVFSAIMAYVLKFCSSEDEKHVVPIRESCLFLQRTCRDNPRVRKIFMIN
jgi:hypothetical protein